MSVVIIERDKTTQALLNGTSAQSRCRARLGEFAGDTKGNVMMTFGLMAFSLFGLVGGAVDLGRWLNARDQTFAAVDAAVLAAGRALQTDPTNESGAVAVAMAYYNANKKSRITTVNDTIGFEVTNNGGVIQATGNVKLETYILRVLDRSNTLGLKQLPLFAANELPQAIIKQESDIGFNREVSLMLDVSGSMGSGTKLADMKLAAKDLINLIMKDPGADTWTKVAVVPFSGDVRLPASIYSQVTPAVTSGNTSAWPSTRDYSRIEGSGRRARTVIYPRYRTSRCVSERWGTNKYNNVAPGIGNYVMPSYDDNSNRECVTPSSGEMTPLKNDKAAILAKIQGLTLGGATAGHVGTAWAYYFLSPEWNGVMPSAANHAQPYGTEKLKKIAILMTDGEYNRPRDSKGLADNDDLAGSSVNGQTSAQQAVELCTNMKADGIEVYTVGFDLGGNQIAIDTLANCASGTDHAYVAVDGAALKAAFRDIAIKLTELHLLR